MANNTILNVMDVHMTRKFRESFMSSFSEDISSMTLCSPYFDKLPNPFRNIVEFCRFVQSRSNSKIEIITGPPGRENTSLSLEFANALAVQDVDIFVRTQPYLHAKFYHLEYVRGYFRSYVGSANFTRGGFERNDELVVEMVGSGDSSPVHREISRLRDVGSMPLNLWLVRNKPHGAEEVP